MVGGIGSTSSLNSIIESFESSIFSSVIFFPSSIFSSIIISLSDSTSRQLSVSSPTFEFEAWSKPSIDPFSPNKGWESGPRLLLGSFSHSSVILLARDEVIVFCEFFCDCEKCWNHNRKTHYIAVWVTCELPFTGTPLTHSNGSSETSGWLCNWLIISEIGIYNLTSERQNFRWCNDSSMF